MTNPIEMAVLFADVSGSTRLYETVGDAEALACIDACLGALRGITERHRGRVVKTIGDELMCVFPNANACAEAASEMQAHMLDRPPVAGVKLAIRVGFHHGPLLESGNDVFGDTVNLAARMAGIAKAGQIITTRQSVELLSAPMRAASRCLDALAVKGKQSEIDVHELIWQESDELTLHAGRIERPIAAPQLRLIHDGREILVGPERPSILLGRDATCDIVITDRLASRQHAKIERRRDKFVLSDQSSNGTFVAAGGRPEIVLKREEFILQGSGTIAFGHSGFGGDAERIEFYCE
jgi:class 3 adenylate cyclase